MKTITRWLVVRPDGDMRIRSRKPAKGELDGVEFAVRIDLQVPEAWGSVLDGAIEVTLPEPPAVEGHVEFDDDVTVVS